MLPDSPKESVSEPVTPESQDNNARDGSTGCPTAPKGKPKATPLIHGKIKPVEAGYPEVQNGSKIPLLKSKFKDVQEYKKPLQQFSGNRSGIQSKQMLETSRKDIHRTVERIKVSKGIEMNRIVQESNGVKPRKPVVSAASDPSNKSSNFHGTHSSQRRIMIRTEASFPKFKSYSGRQNQPQISTVPANSVKNTGASNINDINRNENLNEVNDQNTDKSYKTVEEFLEMPEVPLPDKPPTVKPTKLYKCKFWEYLNPPAKSSNSKSTSAKEQKKPYDPEDVKNFMQKQKENRRLQQIKENKEKQQEYTKRQRMLKELDSKCQRIALKGKQRGEPIHHNACQTSASVEAKKPKLQSTSHPESLTPCLKYLTPLLAHRHSSDVRKSEDFKYEAAQQAQHYLLAEFANIVKRECISIFNKPNPTGSSNQPSPRVEKVDKSVCTSMSYFEEPRLPTVPQPLKSDTSLTNSNRVEEPMYKTCVSPKISPTCPSQKTVENAATKIQAYYRGYKIRQALHEAKIKLYQSRKRYSTVWPPQEEVGGKQEQAISQRRWSFPRLPEKPYDHTSSKLLPMSPIPMVATSDYSIPYYIPPPPPPIQAVRTPSKPKVLSSFPLTPVRLRVYDEPYPRQVSRHSDGMLLNCSNEKSEQIQSRSVPFVSPKSLDNRASLQTFHTVNQPQASLTPAATTDLGLNVPIPTARPSIFDVIREKVRLSTTGGTNLDPTNTLNEMFGTVKLPPVPAGESVDKLPFDFKRNQPVSLEKVVTPKGRTHKHKRRSHSRSHHRTSSKGDSTTTVDTDVELTSSSASAVFNNTIQSSVAASSKSDDYLSSSNFPETITSDSFGRLVAPALRLRYEAEREHLQIIEKALHVKLQNSNAPPPAEPMAKQHAKSVNEDGEAKLRREVTDRSDTLQLAIANCQKESMKAAAEMAKWMSEFRMSSVERDNAQTTQTPVDLAAMVYAAVEQARIIGEEKRREKELEKIRNQACTQRDRGDHGICEVNKADKSAETSLWLIEDIENNLMLDKTNGNFIQGQPNGLHTDFRDYQQQFPSESERGSPIVPAKGDYLPVQEDEISTASKPASSLAEPDNNISQSRLDDLIDYQSIIPSGNSVEFTSFGPKVSSLGGSVETSLQTDDTNKQTSVIHDLHSELEDHEITSNLSNSIPDETPALQKSEDDCEKISEDFVYDEESYEKETSPKSDIHLIDSVVDVASENLEIDKSSIKTYEEEIISEDILDKHDSMSSISSVTSVQLEESNCSNEQSVLDAEATPELDTKSPETESKAANGVASASVAFDAVDDAASENLEIDKSSIKTFEDEIVSEDILDKHDSISSNSSVTSVQREGSNCSNERLALNAETTTKLDTKTPEPESKEDNGVASVAFDAVDDVASYEDSKRMVDDVASYDDSKRVIDDVETEGIQSSGDISRPVEAEFEVPLKPPPPYSPRSNSIPDETLVLPKSEDDCEKISEDFVYDEESYEKETSPKSDIHLIDSVVDVASENLEIDKSSTKTCEDEIISDDILDKRDSLSSNSSVTSVQQREESNCSNERLAVDAEATTKLDTKSPEPESKEANDVVSVAFDAVDDVASYDDSKRVVDDVETEGVQSSGAISKPVEAEFEVPLKPPPPYSPSSSLDSTSLSSRSLIVSFEKNKLEQIVQHQADLVWEARISNKQFPGIQQIMSTAKSDVPADKRPDDNNGNGNFESLCATQSLENLLNHLVYKIIKDVLQVPSDVPYIEIVRPGPLALQAQNLRVPTTKPNFINLVMNLALKAIPSAFISDHQVIESDKSRLRKWCSKPRELVDEVLLNELVEEDYQWTEWWPEEVLVMHQVCEKTIKKLISDVLQKRAYVFNN